MIYDRHSPAEGAWDDFLIGNVELAVARLVAHRFAGDPEKFRRAATLRAERVLGVKSPAGLALIFGLIPGLEKWTQAEKSAARAIAAAKEGPSEARYLGLMRRHATFRAALLALGGLTPAGRSR